MKETAAITEITLRHQTESDLFDGADAATLATVDVEASIAAFEAEWRRWVQQTWPGARIQFSSSIHTHAVANAGDDYNAETQAEEQAQQLAEALFNDGNSWMVEATDFGGLYDYDTAEYIRPATEEELAASREAAKKDGGAGVIAVDGRSCYVADPA